jgi:hypothetical protein
MSYYYIKAGGTATGTAGKYGSQKSGSWATAFGGVSEYYGSIRSALSASAPSNGDVFCVSSLHDYTNSGLSDTTTGSANNVAVVCVSDSDVTSLSTGAKETWSHTSSSKWTLGFQYMYGMEILCASAGHLSLANEASSNRRLFVFENCIFRGYASTSILSVGIELCPNSSYYPSVRFLNCTLDLKTYSSNTIYGSVSTPFTIEFIKCTFLAATTTTTPLVSLNYFASDPCYVIFKGCDFTGANRPLQSTSSTLGHKFIQLEQCVEAANTRYTGQNTLSRNVPIRYNWCGPSSGVTSYYTETYRDGSVNAIGTVYRTGGAKYDDSHTYSLKIESGTTVIVNSPLRFKIAEVWLDTTSAKTFTVEFAQNNAATALTTRDFWVDVLHSDDSTPGAHLVTGRVSLLSSGSNHTTSSVTWNGLTNPTKQYTSISSTETGKAGMVTIWGCLNKASVTMYICPKVTVT